MINPKYDSNNYLKHLSVAVITDNQKINQLFGSYLLRVRWWHDNPKVSPQSDLIGTLRVHMDTPFGAVEPRDYQFKISSHKQIYVQFLTIPIPEFEYKIEVIHPVGLTRSKIELWEYKTPVNYQTESSVGHSSAQSSFDPTSLVAATNANTLAIGTVVSALNAQPALIADAIDNNSYDTSAVNPPPVIGTVATLVLAADITRVKANFRNESGSNNKTIKIFASTVPLTTAALAAISYNTLNSLDELLKGDSWESLDGESKSNFYAIAAVAGANLAITTTRTV
jgi:hypothetical protein